MSATVVLAILFGAVGLMLPLSVAVILLALPPRAPRLNQAKLPKMYIVTLPELVALDDE
jgi:hypothetical protein